jgi:hypothetical protein
MFNNENDFTRIAEVTAREILDSRGNPTIEVAVSLLGGDAVLLPSRPVPQREPMKQSSYGMVTRAAMGEKASLLPSSTSQTPFARRWSASMQTTRWRSMHS